MDQSVQDILIHFFLANGNSVVYTVAYLGKKRFPATSTKKTPRKTHHPCFQNVQSNHITYQSKTFPGLTNGAPSCGALSPNKDGFGLAGAMGSGDLWLAGLNTLAPNTKDQEMFLEDKRFGRSESAHRIRRFYIYTVPMKYVNLCRFLHVETQWGRNWVLRIIVVIQLPKGTPTGRVK